MSNPLRRWTILLVVSALLGQGLIQAAQGATSPTQRQTQIDQQKRDLQQKIKVADEQATALTRQIEASDARKADLDQQSGQLTARLRDAEQRLVTTESDLGLALTDLYSVESSLTTTLDKADVLRQQTSGRSRQIYEAGGIGMYAALLVGAGTFRDFVSRLGFVAKVLTADQDRIDGIEHLTTQLKDNRDQVIQRKTDITQKKTAIETERASISDLQQQVIDNRRAVVAEIATRQRLLSKVQADKASYLKQVAQLAAESRSIAALLRSRQRGQVFQAGIGKNLAWPTTGSVTSPFGWRIHPIFGDRRLHTGVDIGAPYGQAVVAAAAGTVISVSNQGGYGLSVVIDHGGALATLYAHLSATSVSVGQQVARGARVASVGCSGYCTGPHLHYETRVNGEPVDPMGFY
ncbi:MAG: murein hydrolase activator EnvC [Actinomycetota bacterium]